MTQTATPLTITTLGHRGDGIAITDDGPIYVPGALAGEDVLATVQGGRATKFEIVKASPDRIEPQCQHFEACGGCSVQHLASDAYLQWKRQSVVEALETHGIQTEVSPVHPSLPKSRRRAVLTAVRAGRHVLLGYHEKASHRVVDIQECPVLAPSITQKLPGLKGLCAALMPKKGELRLTVLDTDFGLDVAFENADKKYDTRFATLSQTAMELDLARLTINGETLLQVRQPVLKMGDLSVLPPPAGFTQATAAAEQKLSSLILDNIGNAKRVADLFAGIGTFALRMAHKASVHAVEGNAPALAALDQALRVPRGLKKVTYEKRDLFRRPMMAAELDDFDAVVFDPPRAGAQAQAEQIGKSKVKHVVAVSCNPATLARDLRLLIDGGYSITSVTPVDQFLYSPHVECVVALTKSAA
ncbi:MAG: class I SAM-dependent RNA methyltransferase [Rhodobacteraceae bacterium]|nr:class I SAM-dependent RNA methyltransferase [Paracoccaceae bacterium]